MSHTMKFNDTLTEVIKNDLAVSNVPALLGDAGIGKSSFVEDLAKEMGTKAFVLPCNQLADKADLSAPRLVLDPNTNDYTQQFYPHHVITNAIAYAENNPSETPILFLDEINRTTADITSAVLTLVTLRELGSKKLPKNLRLIVAGNDKGNVVSLDEASVTRFTIYHVVPHANTLLDIVGDRLHPAVKDVLTAHPECIFERSMNDVSTADGDDDDDDDSTTTTFNEMFDMGEEITQLATPRTIVKTSDWLNKVDPDLLRTWFNTVENSEDGTPVSLLRVILEAHSGNTNFTTYLVAKIGETMTQSTTNTSSKRIPKPSVYDALVSQPTRDDIEDHVQHLTERERSGCLLYSLFDKTSRKDVIQILNRYTAKFEPEHTEHLNTLIVNDLINDANFSVFTECKDGVAAQLSGWLSMLS